MIDRDKWYPGKITRERADGIFEVAYDDDESEMRVEKKSMLRLLDVGGGSGLGMSVGHVSKGSKIEGNYSGLCTTCERSDGIFDVAHDERRRV